MSRCTAPVRGHSSSAAAANYPACRYRSGYGGYGGYSGYSGNRSYSDSSSYSSGRGGGGRSILAGGPFIESTHGKIGFTAPLSAITAAVVGVILNLALFFAYHVLWPQGLSGRFDWISAALALGATFALFRFKAGVLPLLGVSAMIGLIVTHALPYLH